MTDTTRIPAEHAPWRLRLAISMPALLTLFTLAYGLASYQLFSSRWVELEELGAGEIASDLLRGHLYAMIVLSALALASGLGLAITILKPIREVEAVARSIASGQLDERARPIAATGELGDLSRSFNSMIEFLNGCIADRNRYLLDGVATGLLAADMQGNVTAVNTVGARLLGVRSEDVVGRRVDELLGSMPSRHRAFWEFVAEALSEDRTQLPDEAVLGSENPQAALLVGMSVLRDKNRIPTGVMVNFRDASEIRDLNRQLTKADQLAALGTFTMGLAHEIRNPLGAIKGLVQLLELEGGASAGELAITGRVVREVDRLDRFIRELLDFSSCSPTPPEPTDINRVMRSARDLALDRSNPDWARDVEIIEDYGENLHAIVEPERAIQAMANILRNALEATPPGGRITLRTRARSEGAKRFIEARIHNTGSTVADEDREKVFDPFFSTKERGSGLGLAVAYQIIAQNGGSLDLSSGPDDVTFVARFRPAEPAARADEVLEARAA